MNVNELNKALLELAEKRNELAAIDYSDKKYDDLEEALHDLEDEFLDEFGEYMEKVLTEVHDRNFPESDVLSPIAYLAKKYVVKTTHSNGVIDYNISAKDGVWVEAFTKPNKNVRLVLLPNPPRFIMSLDNGQQKEVWNITQEPAKA
jgi:hypothetical protein